MAFPFVTLSFIFSNCERLVNPIYATHHHALWASYISLTTVGYGTDEAQTTCGRSVSLVLIILGIMGTSMLISKVQDGMHMTPKQQIVMRMIAEKEKMEKIRTLSAKVIQQAWMAYIHKQRNLHRPSSRHGKEPALDTKEVAQSLSLLAKGRVFSLFFCDSQ